MRWVYLTCKIIYKNIKSPILKYIGEGLCGLLISAAYHYSYYRSLQKMCQEACHS